MEHDGNAAGNEMSKLAYSRSEVVMISWGGPLHTRGALGSSLGETNEHQGCVKIFVILLHVPGIVLDRLSLVHGVKSELEVIVLNGLEVHLQGLLDATWRQLVYPCGQFRVSETHHLGSTLTGFMLSSPLIVASYRGKKWRTESLCKIFATVQRAVVVVNFSLER